MDRFIVPEGEWFPKNVFPLTEDNGLKFWRWLLCRDHIEMKNKYKQSVAMYYLQLWYDLTYSYAEEYVSYQIKEGYLVISGEDILFTREGRQYITYLIAGGIKNLASLKPILHFEMYKHILNYNVPQTEQAYHSYLFDHYHTNENQLYQYQFEHFLQNSLTCQPHLKSGQHYLLSVPISNRTEPLN